MHPGVGRSRVTSARGRRAIGALLAALALVAVGVPSVAETVTKPQEVGDEFVPGHDITRVRYTNRTGSLTATMWVGKLHRSDDIELMIATADVPDYNYRAVGKLVAGETRGEVRTSNIGTPEDTVTCHPSVRFDFARDKVTIRMPDLCFPGSDLSRFLLNTGLGVRGHNILGDYTTNYVVRRD